MTCAMNIKTIIFCSLVMQGGYLSAAIAETQISILAAGEAYEGVPAFEVRMGDEVVGRGELVKAIDTVDEGRLYFNPTPDAYLERFDFSVDAKTFRRDVPIQIVFMNDKFKDEGWGRDRNLFIRSVEVNGLIVHAADLRMTDGVKVQNVNYQAGLLPVYRQGHMAVAEAPEAGWPMPVTPRSSSLAAPHETAIGVGG